MNWLDFFASVVASITSLAWPLAMVAAVWMFRGEIRPLLPRLRLKHKETEITFRLDEAEKVVEHLPAPNPNSPPETPEEVSRFEQVARLSPRGALLEVRAEFENELRTFASEKGVKPDQPITHILRSLRKNQMIGEAAAALADDIRVIGNRAAHVEGFPVSEEMALRYKELTNKFVDLLEFGPVLLD
jgi:hypothetical protein